MIKVCFALKRVVESSHINNQYPMISITYNNMYIYISIIYTQYIYISIIYIFNLWIPSYNQLCTYRTRKEMPMHAHACILVDHVKLSKGGSKQPYLILKPTYCRWVIYNHMPWPIKRGEIWWNLSFYIIYVFCIYIYIFIIIVIIIIIIIYIYYY